jgi:hypothetical protein
MDILNQKLMLKYSLPVFALLVCLQVVNAQAGASRKGMFYSINSGGWIKGASESAFQWQTVNGFQKNNFFVGLGVGLDRYRFTGIPVFADGRIYTGRSPQGFFLYEDAGLHYVVGKDRSAHPELSYSPGFYNDAGIGYKIIVGGRTGLLLSGGWSYKRVKQSQSVQMCPVEGPCQLPVEIYKYDFSRLIIKLGLGL